MPKRVQIVHILHVDKLASVVQAGGLYCDSEVRRRNLGGTEIGLRHIKDRRVKHALKSYPDLHVGDCVPFYFWPRSVMLYKFYMHNDPELAYVGGQEPIVHLVADFNSTADWAAKQGVRWVFTDSNAGSAVFEEYTDRRDLQRLDWKAISRNDWRLYKEQKQAEFLLERFFPFELVQRIGVFSEAYQKQVCAILNSSKYQPQVQVHRDWYYGD